MGLSEGEILLFIEIFYWNFIFTTFAGTSYPGTMKQAGRQVGYYE